MAKRERRNKGHDTSGEFDDSVDGGSSRREAARDPGYNGPGRPENWRDVVNTDYEYPAEMDELNRRDRRHAKKEWRKDDHAQRMAWLRDQRQAEPVSPLSVLVVVILLGIIILGIGGGLPKILGKDEAKQPVGLLTPADPIPLPTDPGASAGSSESVPAPSDLTTPPLQTGHPSPEATTTSNQVVAAWARKFYTRNPAVETYDELITNASQYMTADMASSLSAQGDSTYEALKTDGGASKVVSADVSAPREGTAPTDTPTRISRFVNVVIDISGKKPQRITVPLLVTLVQQGSTWVISDVNGGTGP
jgi:hypothetical protein